MTTSTRTAEWRVWSFQATTLWVPARGAPDVRASTLRQATEQDTDWEPGR